MIILIIILIIFLLIIFFFGKKKGFDNIHIIWLFILYILMICIYNKVSLYVIITLCILFKHIRIPIYCFIGVLLTICGGRYKTLRILSLIIFNIELDTQINISNIPKNPTIFITNYPSNYIEYLIPMFLGDKVCLLVRDHAVKTIKYLYGIDNIIGVEKGKFDKLQKQIKEKMDQGYHIYSYVERDFYNRKNMYNITELRSGMFSIAKNINVTITTIVSDHVEHIGGIINNNFKIIIGKTKYVKNVSKEMENTSKFFRKNLRNMSFK